MSLIDWFAQKKTLPKVEIKKEQIALSPEFWSKCPGCGEVLYKKNLEENLNVCGKCQYHFRISSASRIKMLTDEDSFLPSDEQLSPKDFLIFSDTQKYSQRIEEVKKKSGLKEAVITGRARIGHHPICLGVMDFSFMGGSMGSVVGEKLTRLMEESRTDKIPLVIVCATGGARMQEGILSLMQMAKTSAALARLDDARIPYIAVFTDPTTAGVLASFGMLADIIISEPGILIGFAGPRVIEQTIRQKLPKGFQRAEYLVEHGMVDMVLNRKDIKSTLIKILDWYRGKNNG